MSKSQNHDYLALRVRWFKLKAKEFIQRYAAGLLVVALLLPGVAAGENLNILLTILSRPFVVTSDIKQPFSEKIIWAAVLTIVFLVWAKAQKTAIDGGPFNTYLKSMNLGSRTVKQTDFLMLVIADHFLWVFILFGFCSLFFLDELPVIHIIRYISLVIILIVAQQVIIFADRLIRAKKLSMVMLFLLILVLPLPFGLEGLRLALLILGLFWIQRGGFVKKTLASTRLGFNHGSIGKRLSKPNFYMQMLFKASFASSCFRALLLVVVMTGFIITAEHFKSINDNNLEPHAFIVTAILAFFLSGFYLLFRDQRLSIAQLLTSLPISRFFWFKRDVLTVVLISTLLQLPYYFWLGNQFNYTTALKIWVFHVVLLLVSYPLRMFNKEPTFSTLITLMILTIIFVYNFT